MTSLHPTTEDRITDDADLTEFGTDDYTGPDPLFVGDTGVLPLEVRQVFVTLLKKRYISAERHPKDWQVVLANEPALRTRLNDMFLDLIIDRAYEVAYKRQAHPEGGHRFPTVLHDIAYGREETILLVHLRRMIRTGQQAGEAAVFVDRAALLDEVATYRPRHATNHVAYDQAAANAVKSLVKSDLLLKTAEADRYRISPIIEVLLPVDRIAELHAWLREQNTGAQAAADDDPTPDDSGSDGDGEPGTAPEAAPDQEEDR